MYEYINELDYDPTEEEKNDIIDSEARRLFDHDLYNINVDINRFNKQFKEDITNLVSSITDYEDLISDIRECFTIKVQDGYYEGVSIYIDEINPNYNLQDIFKYHEELYENNNMTKEKENLISFKIKELLQEYDYMLGYSMNLDGGKILLENGYVSKTEYVDLKDPNHFNQSLDFEKLNAKHRDITVFNVNSEYQYI